MLDISHRGEIRGEGEKSKGDVWVSEGEKRMGGKRMMMMLLLLLTLLLMKRMGRRRRRR